MSLLSSYSPNYYSIDDILATQERVVCKVAQNVPHLGKLNPAAEEQDLKAGTMLELPIWMIMDVSSLRQRIFVPELPKFYKENYREILKADPCAVELNKFGLYFYELGGYVKQFDHKGDVNDILINTFKQRYRQLMTLADHSFMDPATQQKLDALERNLFKVGHDAKTRLNTWLVESHAPIEAADMVLNHKKRKRGEIEDLL